MFLGIVNIIGLIISTVMFPFICKLNTSFVIYTSIYPLSFFLIAIYAFRKHSSYYDEHFNNDIIISSFIKRILAFLLDCLIMLPIIITSYFIQHLNHILSIVFPISLFFLWAFYNILFVGKFGRTPGKMIMRIKIININNKPMTYRNSFYRILFQFILSLIPLLSSTFTLLSLDPALFNTLDKVSKISLIRNSDYIPVWLNSLFSVLILIEYLTLVFNKRLRTFHDFLGGSIVVNS